MAPLKRNCRRLRPRWPGSIEHVLICVACVSGCTGLSMLADYGAVTGLAIGLTAVAADLVLFQNGPPNDRAD